MPRYKVHVRREVTEYMTRIDTAEIEVEADSDSRADLNHAIREADNDGDISWEYGDSEPHDSSEERPELDRDYDVEPLDEPEEDDDAEPDEANDDEPSEVDKLLANTTDDE